MLKKTITYADFNGVEHTEDFYFNLTRAEVIELGIREDLETIKRSSDNNRIMDAFKHLLKAAYGTRTSDGKFLKLERDFELFVTSEAYSNLFIELISDADYAASFVRGIMPANLEDTTGKTPSEAARAASEANMQGFKKPAEKFEEIQTPGTMIEQGPSEPQFSPEELARFEEYKRSQAAQQNNQ